MLDKLNKLLKGKPTKKAKPTVKETEEKKSKTPKKPKASAKPKLDLSNPKDLATSKGEPWVTVLSMELDKDNPSQGAFELDWNDIFVARLIKAGYQGKTDQDIVDNWFKAVCSNVVMENFEQEMADPSNRVNRRDLGNGRTEIS
jgi:hypothetical protein